FRDLGSQRVKNISRPIRVWQWTPDQPARPQHSSLASQQVAFCTSADGTHIAWASVGEGPAILRAPHWMNHIEYELQSAFKGPFLSRLASRHRLVRFDQRCNGLSDWEVERVSEEAMIEDMEAVVAASGLDRFALLGLSQGAAYCLRYAARHPERVSCIVLMGGFLRGRARQPDPESHKIYETAKVMIREGWGSPSPLYRTFFTASFLPDAPRAVQDRFDEVQRVSVSPENALRLHELRSGIDVTDIAAQVATPVLVLHAAGDRIAPLEEGRRIARTLPNARFAELPGNNHMVLEGTPAFDRFFELAEPFIREHA
ncbi:alpha/beta fold hydrolase, partial [Cribrihabitans sp. XS_ASV171]